MFKLTQTDWYQESVRLSRLSGQRFSINVILSISMLVALAVSAFVVR